MKAPPNNPPKAPAKAFESLPTPTELALASNSIQPGSASNSILLPPPAVALGSISTPPMTPPPMKAPIMKAPPNNPPKASPKGFESLPTPTEVLMPDLASNSIQPKTPPPTVALGGICTPLMKPPPMKAPIMKAPPNNPPMKAPPKGFESLPNNPPTKAPPMKAPPKAPPKGFESLPTPLRR
jgi:hypothetical protein